MNLYFDTKFTGPHNGTTLISIGIVTDDFDRFYAEFVDYDKEQIKNDTWILKNVIGNTRFLKNDSCLRVYEEAGIIPCYEYITKDDKIKVNMLGTKLEVAKHLKTFLSDLVEREGDGFLLVSDVPHYDMVLLGEIMDYQTFGISPVCYDINIDVGVIEGVDLNLAFNISREKLLDEWPIDDIWLEEIEKITPDNKHNALYDAMVIRALYHGAFD